MVHTPVQQVAACTFNVGLQPAIKWRGEEDEEDEEDEDVLFRVTARAVSMYMFDWRVDLRL